jgi:uncharacterized protein (DUF1015 family)
MSTLVRPFRALRPDAEHAGSVIAPPYDVVSFDEALALAADRPASFLHISRPEIDLPAGTDPHSAAVYAQGRRQLDRLRNERMLVRDDRPSFYVYRLRSGTHVQTGVALTASIAAYRDNLVRKHELTRPDKETDRVRNIEALDAQTGPVLCAHRADDRVAACLERAAARDPLFTVGDHAGVEHKIWRLDEPRAVAELEQALDALGVLYIADGHHRSAAAARVAAARGGPAAASHAFFLAVSFPHDEMRILAYNRIVTTLGASREAFLEALQGAFEVEPSGTPVSPATSACFGLYLPGQWYRLRLQRRYTEALDPVAGLDVSLLQQHILGPVLGIEDVRTDPRIGFVGGIRGPTELERRVDAGEAAAAFALFPTRMDQLMAVADANSLMPPKSTWFEPKLADGLLSHVLD